MKQKSFTTVEELLMDESFLNCYYQTDPEEFQRWQNWIDESPEHKQLVREAIQLLSVMLQVEQISSLPKHEMKNGFRRLTEKIKSGKITQYIRKK